MAKKGRVVIEEARVKGVRQSNDGWMVRAREKAGLVVGRGGLGTGLREVFRGVDVSPVERRSLK
jgi:hypothetical protein